MEAYKVPHVAKRKDKAFKGVAFRVEHKEDKKGIFWSEHAYKINKHTLNSKFGNILPLDCEFSHLKYSKYKCAFLSLEQLLDVFDKDILKAVERAGFQLVKVEGKIIKGETQVIFREKNVKTKPFRFNRVYDLLAEDIAKREITEEFGQFVDVSLCIIND